MPIRRLRAVLSCAVMTCCFLGFLFVASSRPATAAEAFALKDDDRVLLIGSTFVERAQSHGYLEAALTSRFPGTRLEFRNLGWSGDNVWGEARAGFGPIEEGFKHLADHVESLKPTVILLNYGANESFAGEAGLPNFLQGFDRLLKMLDTSGAKIVFLLPPPQEDLGPPLPDPKQHNQDLKTYGKAISKIAAERKAPVVDLTTLLDAKHVGNAGPTTDNSLHFTAYGYWRAAPQLEQGLGLGNRDWQVVVTARDGNVTARGTNIRQAKVSPTAVSFTAHDSTLPYPPAPQEAPAAAASAGLSSRVLRVHDLEPGQYTLKIAGQDILTTDTRTWAAGVQLTRGPEFDQAERMRENILVKNELYFHRWRPQNVTYLFGFRKHEQGNNAVEIPQFDPLVAEREITIRELSVPVAQEYQLVKVEE